MIIVVLSVTALLGLGYAMEMSRENETLNRYTKAVVKTPVAQSKAKAKIKNAVNAQAVGVKKVAD